MKRIIIGALLFASITAGTAAIFASASSEAGDARTECWLECRSGQRGKYQKCFNACLARKQNQR